MGRILGVVMGLSLMAYLAYRTMYGGHATDGSEKSQAKQRLDNVQKAADRIEDQQQDALNKTFEKSSSD